jgi:glutamate-1-semialdehyde 2,1-aminomutase
MTTPSREQRYRRSGELLERARRVIPGGVWGHNRFPAFLSHGNYPYFASRGSGSRLIDVDGHEYIDYLCGYGAMVNGFANAEIDAAAAARASAGDCLNLPTDVSVALAERLCSIVSGVDWCAFGKNGSDAVSTAVLIARAHTGRRRIVCIRDAYHGSHFWCNWCNPGTGRPIADAEAVITVSWNDVDELTGAFAAHGNEIAAIVATPFHHPIAAEAVMPDPGWWATIERLCADFGTLMVVDDVRTGYRLDFSGSHVFFGFSPDLVCQSKALANTHPLSTVLGTQRLRDAADSVFAAGTFWSASAPMAAALENLRQLEDGDGVRRMWELGAQLTDGLVDRAARAGFALRVTGAATMPTVTFVNDERFEKMSCFAEAMVERGSLVHPSHNWFVSAAHTPADIATTLDHAQDVFASMASSNQIQAPAPTLGTS